MSKPIITIIGLGLTGTSLGLALQRQEGNFEIVGHDKEPNAASGARKMGAVHRTEWNLHRSCESAEMLVLAVPLKELEELLDLIQEDLHSDCLVLAIAKVMQPTLDLAVKHLPSNVHFVTGHPILTGIGGSLTIRDDLFTDVPFCLSTGLETDGAAVQLATDFVERISAKPLFMDAQEHDGIVAGVEQLPQFLAAILLQTMSQSAGWAEARRLAGRQFAQGTELAGGAERLYADFQTNRENILLRIEQFETALAQWRELLTKDFAPESYEGEDHPLLAALKQVETVREQWETQAFLKNWDETPVTEQVAGSNFIQQMFFGNLLRNRAIDREEKQKSS
ncbi:prephenate dehydrogenase/arogenate dehydrogenase family protein [Chloroflexi bacterium TSY]|nr:prephenate dehydrogenase/arogenate dehydrogenase family protein [Chloroflexi bacterium TSY]